MIKVKWRSCVIWSVMRSAVRSLTSRICSNNSKKWCLRGLVKFPRRNLWIWAVNVSGPIEATLCRSVILTRESKRRKEVKSTVIGKYYWTHNKTILCTIILVTTAMRASAVAMRKYSGRSTKHTSSSWSSRTEQRRLIRHCNTLSKSTCQSQTQRNSLPQSSKWPRARARRVVSATRAAAEVRNAWWKSTSLRKISEKTKSSGKRDRYLAYRSSQRNKPSAMCISFHATTRVWAARLRGRRTLTA